MKWFRYGACLLLFLSLFCLPEPNKDYLFLQTFRRMVEDCLTEPAGQPGADTAEAPQALPLQDGAAVHLASLDVLGTGPEAGIEEVEREVRRLVTSDLGLNCKFVGTDRRLWRQVEGQIRQEGEVDPGSLAAMIPLAITAEKLDDEGCLLLEVSGTEIRKERREPYFRVFAILPPMLAILAALLFQRTLLALFLGVWLGATLIEGMNPIIGVWRFIHRYLFEQALLDQFRLDIIGFVVVLCATVGVLTRGGGIQGLVNTLMKLARSVRSTQMATYLMGLAIFFDDYANCIIVGNTLRPLTDRMKISREKLSYIVDSTAAPVAGLAMLSTWIAYEVSTFSAQLPEAGVQEGAYAVFFQTIPYRFYCLFTLAFIFMQILLQRDFGPMLKAERRAWKTGETIRPGGTPMVSSSMTKIAAKGECPARWYNAFFPILCMIVVTVEELWRMGGGWRRPLGDFLSPAAIREVLGAAADDNTARPILMGAAAGLALAVFLMRTQRILTLPECLRAAITSTKALAFAIAILLMAWCIGGVCSDIGTAHYLIALFKGVINPVVFPTILFVTSCLVAFATGSSWSTMSILLPNTVILAVKIGELSSIGPMPMLVISIGAVLEGSIFGDHCSPISDTTILSSVSSASDHMDHIKTQAPYAICTMVVAVLAGYLPAALGCHPGISMVAGLAALVLILLFLGRRTRIEVS